MVSTSAFQSRCPSRADKQEFEGGFFFLNAKVPAEEGESHDRHHDYFPCLFVLLPLASNHGQVNYNHIYISCKIQYAQNKLLSPPFVALTRKSAIYGGEFTRSKLDYAARKFVGLYLL